MIRWSGKQGWIGVDLGSSAVKIAQIEKRGGDIELVDAAIIRRCSPWSAKEEAPTSSREEIHAGLAMAANLRGRSMACLASMAICDVRGFRVDLQANSLDALARHHLSQQLGDDLSAWTFDQWAASRAPGNAENLFALLMTKPWTNQIASDIQELGLYGNALDGLPQALIRAWRLSAPTDEGPMLLIDWGFRRATVCVAAGEQPLFVRCLRGGGFSQIADALTDALGISLDEAQKVLAEAGLPPVGGSGNELQSLIGQVAAEPMNSLLDELERTIAFLGIHLRDMKPDRALLFGGGATIAHAADYIEARTGISTAVWKLGSTEAHRNRVGACPIELLGPAVALSALSWSEPS